MKSALNQYSKNDQENTSINESEAISVMMEVYEIVRDMYHNGTPKERLNMMAGAIEWVLDLQQKLAQKEEGEEEKKRAHRRYQDAVLALSKAFALSSGSDEASQIREEVGFFQAVRAALLKSRSSSGVSAQERGLAIQQIVSRAVITTPLKCHF